MNKHKSKALEDGCKCNECSLRFECFTQERIFSDPIFQGLFEVLMAQGKSREEALELVVNEIKARIPVSQPEPTVQPWQPNPYGTSAPYVWDTTTVICDGDTDISSGAYSITYTMLDGDKVTWTANSDGSYRN